MRGDSRTPLHPIAGIVASAMNLRSPLSMKGVARCFVLLCMRGGSDIQCTDSSEQLAVLSLHKWPAQVSENDALVALA